MPRGGLRLRGEAASRGQRQKRACCWRTTSLRLEQEMVAPRIWAAPFRKASLERRSEAKRKIADPLFSS